MNIDNVCVYPNISCLPRLCRDQDIKQIRQLPLPSILILNEQGNNTYFAVKRTLKT